MGMYDQSWCNGCGTGLPYSDEEEVFCGECAVFYANENPDLINQIVHEIELYISNLEKQSEEVNAE